MPLNSPSPDHIYLFSSPDDVIALVEGAGLKVEQLALFATQHPSASSRRWPAGSAYRPGVVARAA